MANESGIEYVAGLGGSTIIIKKAEKSCNNITRFFSKLLDLDSSIIPFLKPKFLNYLYRFH